MKLFSLIYNKSRFKKIVQKTLNIPIRSHLLRSLGLNRRSIQIIATRLAWLTYKFWDWFSFHDFFPFQSFFLLFKTTQKFYRMVKMKIFFNLLWIAQFINLIFVKWYDSSQYSLLFRAIPNKLSDYGNFEMRCFTY